jgi:tetratricopeptide (TPR) repeat protein
MKMNRFAAYVFALFALFLASCSAGKMAMKKGDKKFKYGEYELSIDYYNKAINHNFKQDEANFKIGEAYRLSNRLKESEPFYEASVKQNTDLEDAGYYYALALKSNEKYDQAKETLESYLSKASDANTKTLAQKELDNLILLN